MFQVQETGPLGQGLPRPGPPLSGPNLPRRIRGRGGDAGAVQYCECGRGKCAVSVSKRGRKFFVCPNSGYLKCKYFKWCDEVKESERRTSPPAYEYPICGCQAGVCRRVSHPSGRYQFVCPIPRGEGSCGYVKWQGTDEASGSSVVASEVGHENNIDELQADISEDILNEISRMEEMEANEMSSHQRDPVQEVIEDRFITETTTEGSVLSEKFGSSMVDNNEALNESHMIDLGFVETPSVEVEGEDLPTPGSEKRSKRNPCSSIICSDSSSLQSSSEQVTVMAGTISRAIDGLAVGIMNNLISVLESMNPKDHKTLSDEAAVTFMALSSLGINFTIFHDRVTGYIVRAKHLSSIETTTSNKQWTADLMSRCNIEKSCYKDVASAHSLAEAAPSASSEHLQSACREASYVKELLIEAEMQLASCEAGTADKQARLLRVSEELVRSKRRWENASTEAAEAVKQCEEREIEMSAAKAAFDTAKTQLQRLCS